MIEQGTPEWHAQRLGKCTASRFNDVLAKGEGKTARTYMLDLMAERLTLQPQGFKGNAATDWGNEHEDDAIAVYEAATGAKVRRVGFFERADLPGVGCSPDGFVSLPDAFAVPSGGLEVKCPFNSRIHLQYYLGGECPKEHLAQVQGGMWVTQRNWWDFCSYDPRMQDYKLSLFRIRVYRDEEFIKNLAFMVKNFLDRMHADLETLNERLNN